MARKLTVDTLLRRVQHEINFIRKLDPSEMNEKLFKLYLEKARVMGYLASVASQLIEKHDLEKRLEKLEELFERYEREMVV